MIRSWYILIVKTWKKRMGYFALASFLCFALFLIIERVRGHWGLRASLRRAAQEGAELSTARLRPQCPPPAQNVFEDLRLLEKPLEAARDRLDCAPPSLSMAEPGRAEVSARLQQWKGSEKKSYGWAEFEKEMEAAQPLLKKIESAVQKTAYDSGFDYNKGFLDFQMGPVTVVKTSCQILNRSALHELHRNNLAAAHQRLINLIKLVALQKPEPLVILQLVRYACAANAFNCTWQAVQTEGWTEEQLAALQNAWQAVEYVKVMRRALEMERNLMLDYFEQIKSSGKKLKFAVRQKEKADAILNGEATDTPSKHGFFYKWGYLPLWRFAWASQDEWAALDRCQLGLEQATVAGRMGWAGVIAFKDESSRHWRPLFTNSESLSWYDKCRYLQTSQDYSLDRQMLCRAFENQTQQQMALAALAIQRYRLRYHKLPENLAALVPEYLPQLPQDWMDMQPLRYRRESDVEFTLYSVGQNGQDDGGDPTPEKDGFFRQIAHGRDMVWPKPVIPKK